MFNASSAAVRSFWALDEFGGLDGVERRARLDDCAWFDENARHAPRKGREHRRRFVIVDKDFAVRRVTRAERHHLHRRNFQIGPLRLRGQECVGRVVFDFGCLFDRLHSLTASSAKDNSRAQFPRSKTAGTKRCRRCAFWQARGLVPLSKLYLTSKHVPDTTTAEATPRLRLNASPICLIACKTKVLVLSRRALARQSHRAKTAQPPTFLIYPPAIAVAQFWHTRSRLVAGGHYS